MKLYVRSDPGGLHDNTNRNLLTALMQFQIKHHITDYHAFVDKWTLFTREFYRHKLKSKNPADKNAPVVLKDSRVLGHLKKRKPGHATKTFHLVKASQMNDASVTLVTI